MATIRFAGFADVAVRVGRSLLDAATKGNVPLGSACGGVCGCSTCHVVVTAGAHLLSPQEDNEADILDKAFDVRPGSRLGCQTRVVGEGLVEVRIAQESVEAYENEHPGERGAYTGRAASGGK
jgi:2Fe-2S ferredoxin